MHYLCPVIATCPSIRNLRPCTLSATSCAPFKVRTVVFLKIEVFRDVDAIGRPRIFDTDTHNASSFGIWLRTRTYGGGLLWVQLCFILVDQSWLRFFFSLSSVWLLQKDSFSLNSCFPSTCLLCCGGEAIDHTVEFTATRPSRLCRNDSAVNNWLRLNCMQLLFPDSCPKGRSGAVGTLESR